MDNFTNFQGPFSVWGWFVQTTEGDADFIAKRELDGQAAWALYVQSDAYAPKFSVSDGVDTGAAEMSGNAYPLNVPVFIAGVYDGTTATLYLNDETPVTTVCPDPMATPGGTLFVQYENGDPETQGFFVHKLGFADRALTYAEIAGLYQEGA